MKEFMMIFVSEDYVSMGLSPDEMQERFGRWFAWSSKMEEAGVLRGGKALQSSPAASIKGPDRTITDKTLAESKEIVGGFYIIEVENLDAAVKVAQDYPDFDLGGSVEVREVMVFNN